MITCTRRIQFCAGHRVMGHENKCANLHGHNYVALISAYADDLDGVGRVVDFSVLKERIGGWIDREWDHGFILHKDDTAAVVALSHFGEHNLDGNKGQKLYLMFENPTAENMAHRLLVVGNDLMKGTGVSIKEVTIWETENCYATVTVPTSVSGS